MERIVRARGKEVLRGAFRILREHTELVYRMLEVYMQKWRVSHFMLVRRRRLFGIAWKKYEKNLPLRQMLKAFRRWIDHLHNGVKIELGESVRKIYQALAAGNLALTHEKFRKKQMLLGWMNISLMKAFRLWSNISTHRRTHSMAVIHAEERHSNFVRREVLATWRRYIKVKQASAISLARWTTF